MRIGDYTAHVLIDGKESEEYHIELPTPTRTTCWIPSQEGKTFSVVWRCHAKHRPRGNGGWVRVDDIFCGGVHMFPGRLGEDDMAEMSCITTDGKARDFIFMSVQLDDDDELLSKEIPQGFGEISIEIEHGRLVKDRCRYNDDVEISDDHNVFHETSNKSGHHRIGFGPEKSADYDVVAYNLIVDEDPSLFFVFKYRPLALLQAHGIVPRPGALTKRSPSPEQKPQRLLSNDSECDIPKQELQARIKNLENKLKRLQDMEARMSQEPKCKRVKMEDSGIGNQHSTVSEVIDLTLD